MSAMDPSASIAHRVAAEVHAVALAAAEPPTQLPSKARKASVDPSGSCQDHRLLPSADSKPAPAR